MPSPVREPGLNKYRRNQAMMSTLYWLIRNVLSVGLTLLIVFLIAPHTWKWWRTEKARKLADENVTLADGRYPRMPVVIKHGNLLVDRFHPWAPDPGTPVYVEERDPGNRTWRLKRVGEVEGPGSVWHAGHNVEGHYLIFHPDTAPALFAAPLQITCYEFADGLDTIKEILISPKRRAALARDLTHLWDLKGHLLKKEFGPILEEVLAEVEEKEGVKLKAITLQEVVVGWLDQKHPAPRDAKAQAIDKFLGEVLRRLTGEHRLPRLEQALRRVWAEMRSVAFRDPNMPGGSECVGLQDLFERYFFVNRPGQGKGFSPEVTLLLRGILYGRTKPKEDPNLWPAERWIVLRCHPECVVLPANEARLASYWKSNLPADDPKK